jgi:ClpP class serine protease
MDYADGRIFSGRQGREYGFVDELGNFEQCLDDVARDLGIEGEPTIVRKRLKEDSMSDLFFEALHEKLVASTEPESKVELEYSLY